MPIICPKHFCSFSIRAARNGGCPNNLVQVLVSSVFPLWIHIFDVGNFFSPIIVWKKTTNNVDLLNWTCRALPIWLQWTAPTHGGSPVRSSGEQSLSTEWLSSHFSWSTFLPKTTQETSRAALFRNYSDSKELGGCEQGWDLLCLVLLSIRSYCIQWILSIDVDNIFAFLRP